MIDRVIVSFDRVIVSFDRNIALSHLIDIMLSRYPRSRCLLQRIQVRNGSLYETNVKNEYNESINDNINFWYNKSKDVIWFKPPINQNAVLGKSK